MASLGHDVAAKLLKGDEFSDFTIICGSHTFPVHKVLIASKSDYLKACVSSGFRESQQQQVHIKEATPLAVASVLYYIYAGIYNLDKVIEIWPDLKPTVDACQKVTVPTKRKLDTADDEATGAISHEDSQAHPKKQVQLEYLRCHMRLYELADRFMMPKLKCQVTHAVVGQLEGNCEGYSGGADPDLDMRDITTIIADVQDYTAHDDIGLRQEVLAWSLANLGCFMGSVTEDVEKAIKDAEPLLWHFGMKVARRLRGLHDFYMDEMKDSVRRFVLAEVAKLPKGKANLSADDLNALFEMVDEKVLWEHF